MIQRIKAQPVSADINNFATQFNAGSIDMIAAPTLAYKPLELNKGLGAKGGIARFPLMILTYQVVLNPAKFPAGFGEKSRGYWAGQFDRAMALIGNADAGIPGRPRNHQWKCSLASPQAPGWSVPISPSIRTARADSDSWERAFPPSAPFCWPRALSCRRSWAAAFFSMEQSSRSSSSSSSGYWRWRFFRFSVR